MKNVLFAVTLIASAVAFADNNQGLFAQLDTDNDGVVSSVEARANEQLTQDFAVLDINADGQLSSDEFQQYAVR